MKKNSGIPECMAAASKTKEKNIIETVTRILCTIILPFLVVYNLCSLLLGNVMLPVVIGTFIVFVVTLILLIINKRRINKEIRQLDLQVLEIIQNSQYLSLGRKGRYIKGFVKGNFDEKIALFLEFMGEEAERKKEYEEEQEEPERKERS